MVSTSHGLISKIQSKEAKIGVIGLGYVGLPLAIYFCEAGFRVTGFDTDAYKVEMLNRGESYINYIHSSKIMTQITLPDPRLTATTDMSFLAQMDAILICVPTPLTDYGKPDLSYVLNTTKAIALHLRKGQLVILESTTYPGTTQEEILPMLEKDDFRAGEYFFLAYSPERQDPGNPEFTARDIPKVIGGVTPQCLEVARALYDQIVVKTVPVVSTKTAEAAKLLENIYRAVNIALVNELKMLFDRMGIDIWEVIDAAKTKPFGFTPFYPGPGLGGHCIPIDPFYLAWKARYYDFRTRFIELAGEINTNMPYYVIYKLMEALNEREKSIRGSRILILGVGYKKDVDDDRESPGYVVMDLLIKRGASILYNDPYIPRLKKSRKYDFGLTSEPLTEELLRKVDAVIIITNHSHYDYNWILNHTPLIIDTRGVFKDGVKKVVRA